MNFKNVTSKNHRMCLLGRIQYSDQIVERFWATPRNILRKLTGILNQLLKNIEDFRKLKKNSGQTLKGEANFEEILGKFSNE